MSTTPPSERLVRVWKRRRTDQRDICARTAKVLAEGNVIGWFQGRSEFGPRALGNRSIIADPRTAEMKDILNSAGQAPPGRSGRSRPIVLVERAERDLRRRRRVALHAARQARAAGMARQDPGHRARRRHRARADRAAGQPTSVSTGCSRSSTRITGVPVLLNTSFNVKGEPIVETPERCRRVLPHHRHRLSRPARYADQQGPLPQGHRPAGEGLHRRRPHRKIHPRRLSPSSPLPVLTGRGSG